jgi:polyhydroxyalkanoate synthesis regulator phasin
MDRFKLLSILITSLLCCFGVQAEEAGDPAAKKTMTAEQILADPYFRAFLQIGLEKEQMPQFKKLIDEYAYQRGKVIDKEKRRYSGDLEDVIKRAHRKISKRFVKKVDSLLNDDQFSRFAAFHEVLDERLKKHESLDENLEASEMF